MTSGETCRSASEVITGAVAISCSVAAELESVACDSKAHCVFESTKGFFCAVKEKGELMTDQTSACVGIFQEGIGCSRERKKRLLKIRLA